eukprot:1161467-Pelagomonas_calceolata.AAC.3
MGLVMRLDDVDHLDQIYVGCPRAALRMEKRPQRKQKLGPYQEACLPSSCAISWNSSRGIQLESLTLETATARHAHTITRHKSRSSRNSNRNDKGLLRGSLLGAQWWRMGEGESGCPGAWRSTLQIPKRVYNNPPPKQLFCQGAESRWMPEPDVMELPDAAALYPIVCEHMRKLNARTSPGFDAVAAPFINWRNANRKLGKK